jgi:hypothetical protein
MLLREARGLTIARRACTLSRVIGAETAIVPKRLPRLAFLGLAASLAFAAHGGGPSRGGGGTVLGRPIVGVYPTAPAAIAPSFRNSTYPRTRFHGPRPLAAVGVPVYVGPPAYYAPPAYAEPPVAYLPPAPPPAPAAPPSPPEREVVEHSDGRYQLRGDGITVPHRWVWIPHPPPPPASKPKPDVRLYGWTDEQGVIHITDRLDRIPERYRAQAQRNASS